MHESTEVVVKVTHFKYCIYKNDNIIVIIQKIIEYLYIIEYIQVQIIELNL